jgi:hypothetical protein
LELGIYKKLKLKQLEIIDEMKRKQEEEKDDYY